MSFLSDFTDQELQSAIQTKNPGESFELRTGGRLSTGSEYFVVYFHKTKQSYRFIAWREDLKDNGDVLRDGPRICVNEAHPSM